ncbi:SusC/RagA family TonB-linked outer membrane protein [Bacteroidia bacterium]|nr:SusC/RagA family TonB-linked outer membrane protein [Bacteroidia bacterium]
MAQQARTIKGVVLDEQSEAIIGASISVPGTKLGVATDVNGRFTLSNVPADQKTIQISYLGYETQTVDINGKSEVNVKLVSTDSELDEVVIVGYGVQKKAHLTGSIATVALSEILDLSVTSLASALSGLMPGVSVGSSSNRPGEPSRITIRGNTTPVYVIDDIVSDETSFNNLDASMIENISVLKDAAAAIYGASSAVGVVLVKTKRGQIGKPKISYNGQFGYTDEFYRSKMLDSYNLGVIWNGVRAADLTDIENTDPKKDFFQADELAAMKNLNIDLLEKYWSSALTQKHSVNVSGGNESATYFAGISYVTQDGNLGNIDYDRWNYNAGVDAKISKYMKASLKVSGDYGSKQKAYNKVGGESDEKDYLTLLTRPRYMPETVTNPLTGRELPIGMYGITNGAGDQTQNYNYSLVENLGNFTKNMPQNMTINGALEYEFGWSQFLKGLKFKFNYSKSIGTTKDNQYGSDYILYRFPDGNRGGSGSHLFVDTEGYPMNFDVMTTVPVSNGGFLRRNMSRSDSYQMNFYATYARKFGLHDVSALFTIEKGESESEYVWGMVMQPYSFTNHQSNGASGDQTTEFKRSEAGKLSYVGRLNYNYAGKYLAEYLVRSDASTKFAPENYWGVFHSFSAGWILSEENWFKADFIDFFKIRGSFGLLGRDNISAWAWLMTYGNEAVKGPIFGNNPDQNAGAHFQMPGTVPNRNAHWDQSYKSNLGLDLNFLRSRLSVNVDGYYEWNRDEFLSVGNAPNYPTTIGAPPSAYNYGATNRFGVELSLGWHDKIGKDFKYHIKLNTGLTDNKLITYPWQAAATRALDASQPNERTDRGLWGYECIGMFRSNQEIAEYFAANNLTTYLGKTQDKVYPGMLIYNNVRGSQKEDGSFYAPNDPNDPKGNLIDGNDRIQISKRTGNPYGFTINLGAEYKSFSLSAQLGASWGSYTMMPSAAISTSTTTLQYVSLPSFWAGNMFVYQDVLDDQQRVVAPQNLDAKYPNLRFGDNSIASTFWKVSNTNIALRNITVAYALPKTWVKFAGVESCRLNLTGQNMLSFYNPYPDKFTNPMVSYNTYPTLRKFTLGLSVTF